MFRKPLPKRMRRKGYRHRNDKPVPPDVAVGRISDRFKNRDEGGTKKQQFGRYF